LKRSDQEFLSENMSIDIEWLKHEFNSSKLISFKPMLELFVSNLVCSISDKSPNKQMLEHFESATSSNEETQVYEILDSLRHAFASFASGGLYDLYVYQSNELWYPKIILKSELKPNDISALPDFINIYRGCNVSEYNNKKYRQSWSTSINIARKFAYQHYDSQAWYEKEKRCVLSAVIKKDAVYFSNQSNSEKEIAVNTEKLSNVKKDMCGLPKVE